MRSLPASNERDLTSDHLRYKYLFWRWSDGRARWKVFTSFGRRKAGDDRLGSEAGLTTIVRKAVDGYVPNQDLASAELIAKAAKVASLLAEGKNAEAIFLAGLVDWRNHVTPHDALKATFNSSEPRDEKGRWSSGAGQAADRTSARIIPVASADDPRGNKMAKDAANEAGLNRAQRRKLHNEITGQGITDFQTILQIAKDIASGGV